MQRIGPEPELDQRINNVLRKLGLYPAFDHLDEIADKPESFWISQRNLGQKSRYKIKDWLAYHGYVSW